MDEQRKHAILFAVTLLCARRILDRMGWGKPDRAKQFWIDDAIGEVSFILERIDRKWPVETVSERR